MFRTFERLYVVSRLTSKIEMTSCHIINRLIYNKLILTVDILCTYMLSVCQNNNNNNNNNKKKDSRVAEQIKS